MPWDSLVGVIQNLVVNSVEAIDAVGRVKISAAVLTPPEAVTIKVEDTGGGMDEATLKRVFEPFFTTKGHDTPHGVGLEGSGLGLWNVYRAVKTAGGSVSMRSQVGAGTTVEVTLPIVRER
jgi:signal transduction histidine kinase